MDWDRVSADLNKKLDPAAIKPPPKGKFGEYVDGYHVISEANRIFGNGGWSYEITRLTETSRQEITLRGQNGEYQQVRVSYMCTVKVHVDGTFKEGSAVGMGSGKPDNLGDVIESAVKEAETDALKRALRTYGNTFGLALYDKSRENVGLEATASEIAAAKEACTACRDLEALSQWWAGLYRNMRHVADHPDVTAAKDAQKRAVTMRGAG
jgi:DNA repair and recombination protein RAD52